MNSHYEKFLATGEVKCIDEEIPFEIPEGWEWVRVGFISEVIGGYAFPSDSLKSGKGDRVIRISDINESGFVDSRIVRYNGIPISDSYKIKRHDILMAMTGGTVGKSLFVKELPEENLWLNQRVAIIRNLFLVSDYLDLVIKAPHIKDVVNDKKNSTNDNISMVDIYRFLIPMPSLEHQKRIVQSYYNILPMVEKYGKAQYELDLLNATIWERIKKSILQEAIQGKLVPQDPNYEPASVLLERIREEKLQLVKEGKLKKKDITDSIIFKGEDNKYFEKIGKAVTCIDEEIPFEIPSSWSWCRLDSICTIKNGFTPLRTEPKFWNNGTISWFTVEDIREQGEYIKSTKQKITSIATTVDRVARAGSVLLCCTASVGECAMTLIPTTTNQQFNALSVKDIYESVISDDYLFLFTKTLKGELHKLSGKTTFEFISVKKVGKILIPIPPLNEQKRIVKKCNSVLAIIGKK